MELLEDYARHAKDCRLAAAKAAIPEQKVHLLEMADRWEGLARQRAVHLHLEDVLTAILKNNGENGGAAAA